MLGSGDEALPGVCSRVWLIGAGMASPQLISPELKKHLGLSESQVGSIDGLNQDFEEKFQREYFQQLLAASRDFHKRPDPELYRAYRERLRALARNYYSQASQLQGRIAAWFTPDQAAAVDALREVVRLQLMIPDAQECGFLPESAAPSYFRWNGDSSRAPGSTYGVSVTRDLVSFEEVPSSLIDFFHLSPAQVSAIKHLASKRLGTRLNADVPLRKELSANIRAVLTAEQQPLLKALDDAVALAKLAEAAIGSNILVLPPPDLLPVDMNFSVLFGV